MDQFAQTNDLQKAIDNVANGGNATNNDTPQFGIPPMPPSNGAPNDMMFTMAPTQPAENGPEMPKVEPLVPPEEPAQPSAEEILSQGLTAENAAPAENVDSNVNEEAPAVVKEAPVEEAVPMDDLNDVKQNILRDLLPLLDKTEKTPEEKFDIYKEALGTMHDVKTIEGAYRAASGISDETKKADALFTLMEIIDKQ